MSPSLLKKVSHSDYSDVKEEPAVDACETVINSTLNFPVCIVMRAQPRKLGDVVDLGRDSFLNAPDNVVSLSSGEMKRVRK